MELEAIRSANSSQHISSSSEPSENVVFVTSKPPRSQPTGHLKEYFPPTHPTQVAVLWSAVREAADDPKSASATEPSFTDSEIMTWPRKANVGGTLNQSAKRPKPKAHNQETDELIAENSNLPDEMPCNIGDVDICNKPACDYFSSKPVEDTTVEAKTPNKSSKSGKEDTFYEAVLNEYTLLTKFESSRTGFSHLTNDCFFGLNSLYLGDSVQDHSSPVKLNICATKIKANKWQAPPGLKSQCIESFPPFACVFGLPKQACDGYTRLYLVNFTYVLGGKMMFPYLTVDFRKDQEEMQNTIQRAACNGAQSLFNRHCLYMRTRGRLEEAAKARDNALHSHFMIVFDNAKFEGWKITADHDDGWKGKGCTMKQIFCSELLEAQDVKFLYEWIQEIHYWGATRYGPACIEDIRTCLMASSRKTKEGPAGATPVEVEQ